MEHLIDWGLVALLAVPLAWALNSGVPLLGSLLGQSWELSTKVKKAVAFAVSAGLIVYWRPPVELPDPSQDLFEFVFAVLATATLAFKAAQEVYDHIWRKIIEGVSGLFR